MTQNDMQQGRNPIQPLTTCPWAIISLISAILSYFMLPLVGAVLAIIAGYIAKKEIRNSQGQIGGDSLATWGLVLGWISIALGLIVACLVLLVLTGAIGLGGVALCGPWTEMMKGLNY